jgi:hypothetical protein
MSLTQMWHYCVRLCFVQIIFGRCPTTLGGDNARITDRRFSRTVLQRQRSLGEKRSESTPFPYSLLFDECLSIVVNQIDFEILLRDVFQRLHLLLANVEQSNSTSVIVVAVRKM